LNQWRLLLAGRIRRLRNSELCARRYRPFANPLVSRNQASNEPISVPIGSSAFRQCLCPGISRKQQENSDRYHCVHDGLPRELALRSARPHLAGATMVFAPSVTMSHFMPQNNFIGIGRILQYLSVRNHNSAIGRRFFPAGACKTKRASNPVGASTSTVVVSTSDLSPATASPGNGLNVTCSAGAVSSGRQSSRVPSHTHMSIRGSNEKSRRRETRIKEAVESLFQDPRPVKVRLRLAWGPLGDSLVSLILNDESTI
jgi:hypothetical protein